MCGVAVVAVCDVWARTRARAVGGVRIAIVRGHVFVVVIEIIIRTREALQIRGRVSPSADTHDRRGGGGVSGGDEASIAVIQDEVQVVLQQGSCGARVRAEQEGTALGFARRLSLGHVMAIMVPIRCSDRNPKTDWPTSIRLI